MLISELLAEERPGRGPRSVNPTVLADADQDQRACKTGRTYSCDSS